MTWGGVDLSMERQAMASDHANGVGIRSHMNSDILGFDIPSSFVHHFERNVLCALIQDKPLKLW